LIVQAAGVVCWRENKGQVEVLLIHRPRYKDWTFPKGKVDPGELLPETAVREVWEETGMKVKLGRKLSDTVYKISVGTKEVHYWASKVSEKSWRTAEFKPNEEVSKVSWDTIDNAMSRLTYTHDQKLLKEVHNLYTKNELDTRGLVLLRHAKATPRNAWKGQEAKRPLLPEGQQQAERLISLLGAFGPRRLVTSSWTRCEQTVLPYSKALKKKLIHRSQLTEFISKKNPKKTHQAVEDFFERSTSALICTHRPALRPVTQILSTRATGEVRKEIIEATSLDPAEFMILRLSKGREPTFLATERWKVS
jgi:8-oxo-dGTP diphosphatase